LPGAFFMGAAYLGTALTVARKRGLSDKILRYRTGYLVSLAGLFVVGWTVHFWNGTYSYFLFLLGSGIWMADVAPAEQGRAAAATVRKGSRPNARNPGPEDRLPTESLRARPSRPSPRAQSRIRRASRGFRSSNEDLDHED